MLRLLVDQWSRVPLWLRVTIGLQVAVAGWLMHVLAVNVGTTNDGPAGFTIGLGLAVIALTVRGWFLRVRVAETEKD